MPVLVGDEPELRSQILRHRDHLLRADADSHRFDPERELTQVEDVAEPLVAGNGDADAELEALVRGMLRPAREQGAHLIDQLPAAGVVGEHERRPERPERAEATEHHDAAADAVDLDLAYDQQPVVDVAATPGLLG